MNFQQETFSAVKAEMVELTRRHWEEIAHNRAVIPLDPDWDKYRALCEAGILQITTAREGHLVGYQVYVVMPHIHYKSSLTAMSDVLYLAPEWRQGMTGIRLMKAAEENLRKLGVQRVLQNVKFSNDWGVILERMGYTPFERIYSKLLER